MRFARTNFSLVLPFLILAFSAVFAFAAEEQPWTGQFTNEFQEVNARLTGVEQKQKDILAEKGKILEELDRLGVWVKHSGGKPKSK